MEFRELDYARWAQEYLQQAAVLEAALKPVRAARKKPHLSIEESRKLLQRERMLYEMYLECRATGQLLKRRGEHADKTAFH